MYGILIRIALRYGAAILVARGLLSDDVGNMIGNDTDIQMYIEMGSGILMGAVAEGWYYLARKFNWAR